jgi:tetraacyldisaccharide 4'-kinase
MRAGLENWFLHHWYGPHRPPWYLRMLEPVYRVAYQGVQKNGKAGSATYRPRLPLVVVGNITAGGSGKTPLVIRLCQLALDLKLKPGIASTGYGRHSQETLDVRPDSDTRECGDEPVLLAQRTGTPVVVAAKRRDAVKKLNGMDVDLVISDDGLQQAGLDRDIDICVIDGERGIGNGHLIPAGPLRETTDRLGQVDYVVTNGEWHKKPDDLDVTVMRLHPGVVRALDDATEYTAEEFRFQHTGTPIHAVAGIGNPKRFFDMLETLGIKTVNHGFGDHHVFSRKDFDSIPAGSAIIMTEKDAVKCRSLGLNNAWYLPVETCLPDKFERLFKDHLAKLVKDSL